MYAIGLDIGTTSVCGIFHDAESGEIVRSLTLPNDCFVSTGKEWAKEQDPKALIGKLKGILDELLSENKKVISIGLTGQMHGIVYLDSKGNPISTLRIWQDGRGNLPYKDNRTYASYMTEKTGYSLASGYGTVTWFYDMLNGQLPDGTVTFSTIHGLAAMMLASKSKPLLHSSDAASLGLFDISRGSFDTTATEKLGLDSRMLPDICGNCAVMGEYKGIPVSVAIGDNQASFIGSVSDVEHSLLVNVGTGSQISCFAKEISESSIYDCRPLLDRRYILAGSSLCGGRAYAMLESLFRQIAEEVSGNSIKSAYPAMDRIMSDADACDEPLSVSTLFAGTRSAPNKRGSVENIGIDNLDMKHLCDGFMCGMADELYGLYCEMKPHINSEKHCMIGSGNGIRNNIPLKRRFERIFGLPMLIPRHSEEAAFGASLYALTAAGAFPDIYHAQRLIKYN